MPCATPLVPDELRQGLKVLGWDPRSGLAITVGMPGNAAPKTVFRRKAK